MHLDQRTNNTARDVVSWRRHRLLDAGFPSTLAHALARETAYDLHALIELVGRGCPPALAARILAPLQGSAGDGA
jgi:hypothetical protein